MTDTSLYIYICVKHFGVENIKKKKLKKFAFYRRMFFERLSQQAPIDFSPNSNNRMVFIMAMGYGLCQVGTELLYTLQFTSRSVFKGQRIDCYCRAIYGGMLISPSPELLLDVVGRNR